MPLNRETRKQNRGDVIIPLVTVNHPDIDPPARAAINDEPVISNGETYYDLPVELTLPDEGENAQYEAAIAIGNDDATIVPALIASREPPTVDLAIVMASAPDTVEKAITGLLTREISFDVQKIEARLGYRDFSAEPACAISFTPATAPGLF